MADNSRDLHILVLKEAKELPSEKSFILVPTWETNLPAKQVLLVLEDNTISPAMFIESCQHFIKKWHEMYADLLIADAFIEYKDTTFFFALSFVTKREESVSVKRIRREVPDTFYQTLKEIEEPNTSKKEEVSAQQLAIEQLSQEEQLLKTKLFDVNNTVTETRTVISQLIGEVQKMNKSYNSQLEQVHARLQNAMSYAERLEARMLANEEDAKNDSATASDRVPRMKLKARESYSANVADNRRTENAPHTVDYGYTPPVRETAQNVTSKQKNPVDIWWEQQHRQTTTRVVPPVNTSVKQASFEKPFVTAASTQQVADNQVDDSTEIDDWLTEPYTESNEPTLNVSSNRFNFDHSDEPLNYSSTQASDPVVSNEEFDNREAESENMGSQTPNNVPNSDDDTDVFGPSNDVSQVSDYEHEAMTTQAKDLFDKGADNEEVEKIKVRTIDYEKYTEGLDYLEYQWHQIIENVNYEAYRHMLAWCEPYIEELPDFMDNLRSEVKQGLISKKYVQMPQRVMYSLQAYNLMGRYLEEVFYGIEN